MFREDLSLVTYLINKYFPDTQDTRYFHIYVNSARF